MTHCELAIPSVTIMNELPIPELALRLHQACEVREFEQ